MSYELDDDRIILEDERFRLNPISPTTAWRQERAGKHPKRVRIGAKKIGWSYLEYMQYLTDLKAARSSQAEVA